MCLWCLYLQHFAAVCSAPVVIKYAMKIIQPTKPIRWVASNWESVTTDLPSTVGCLGAKDTTQSFCEMLETTVTTGNHTQTKTTKATRDHRRLVRKMHKLVEKAMLGSSHYFTAVGKGVGLRVTTVWERGWHDWWWAFQNFWLHLQFNFPKLQKIWKVGSNSCE